jgi:RNA polymerase sigma-70 factor (ECF subfamily)
LTPEQRQVIVLRFLEGLTTREIAQVMEKSIGSVKAQQHRGLAALQRILSDNQEQE